NLESKSVFPFKRNMRNKKRISYLQSLLSEHEKLIVTVDTEEKINIQKVLDDYRKALLKETKLTQQEIDSLFSAHELILTCSIR
ncbi:14641_t:CDS:1, partial [Ambispora leptoticha]